jgi:hypothetical protein
MGEGLHEKRAVAAGNLENLSAICLKTQENQENPCRDDQDKNVTCLLPTADLTENNQSYH